MTPAPISKLLNSFALELIVRIALTCPFWLSGLTKLFNWSAAIGEMNHFGLSPAAPMAAGVILLQLSGSIAIILGRQVWLAAGALGLFTAVATLMAHAYWTFPEAERAAQGNIFFEHVAIIAGLALIAILSEKTSRRV